MFLPLEDSWIESKMGNYDKSEKILSQVKPTPEQENLYNFYRFFNNFSTNNKANADKYSDRIVIQELPERYKILTLLMQEELSRWNSDDVEDISRDMRHVKDRIANNDIHEKTQKIQKVIIAKLDKLIEDLENPPKSDSSSSSSNIQGKQQPLPESSIVPPEENTGAVQQAKLARVASQWGNLPPRERAKVLQELTQGMPPRHREQVENYFRNISAIQSKK